MRKWKNIAEACQTVLIKLHKYKSLLGKKFIKKMQKLTVINAIIVQFNCHHWLFLGFLPSFARYFIVPVSIHVFAGSEAHTATRHTRCLKSMRCAFKGNWKGRYRQKFWPFVFLSKSITRNGIFFVNTLYIACINAMANIQYRSDQININKNKETLFLLHQRENKHTQIFFLCNFRS